MNTIQKPQELDETPKKVSMSIGLTDILDKFKGTWVATETDGGPIICTGESATDIKEKAMEMGYKNPILTCLVQEKTKKG